MRFILSTIFGGCLGLVSAQEKAFDNAILWKDSLSNYSCDTSWYMRKPLFGELEAMAPERISCYHMDSTGRKTDDLILQENFKNGLKHGREVAYYPTTEYMLVNLFGRPFKREISEFRRKVFARNSAVIQLRYLGYWKNGQRQGDWKYYSPSGKLIHKVTFKNGAVIPQEEK